MGLFARWLTITLALLICHAPPEVAAQGDREAAEAVAAAFVRGIDQGDLAALYERHAGPALREGLDKQMFVEQTGLLRVQAGGPANARQLVGGQPFSQTPDGTKGTFYYFRYKSSYPNGGFLFQDVYLEKVGAEWKIAGIWYFPAPPG